MMKKTWDLKHHDESRLSLLPSVIYDSHTDIPVFLGSKIIYNSLFVILPATLFLAKEQRLIFVSSQVLATTISVCSVIASNPYFIALLFQRLSGPHANYVPYFRQAPGGSL